MRVETALVQQTLGIDRRDLRSEALAWARLFSKEYRGRTLIGVCMMFFQRTSILPSPPLLNIHAHIDCM